MVGVGQASTEFLGAAPRLSESDQAVELAEVTLQPGGAAAIATATAAAMGCAARFCGLVADDYFGRLVVSALQDAGVDTQHVTVTNGRLSPFSVIAMGREDGRRAGFTTSGDSGQLDIASLATDMLLDGARALLLDCYYPRAQAALAEVARVRDIDVIVDATTMREGLGELIALADVLLLSERLASHLAPRGELQDSLVELQRLGPRGVVITMGASGSIGLHHDQLVRQPAHPLARVTDTTDAGAIYHGAFTAAHVAGEPFARCMQIASIAAGLSCQVLGGWAGIPDRDDIYARLD